MADQNFKPEEHSPAELQSGQTWRDGAIGQQLVELLEDAYQDDLPGDA
ncbi:hypothetical protein [Ferrimonas marina]|uniref:Uncharacterized protein n=1 Tax=Ferrimonas marina TaxID=299255 RepID=A0A1M5VVT9_9GAMM|nr:hypothetical protein [Ferrimonas marina]SHH79356.1 hypothetical protein SAMN02745129_3020 [Ferrimonas marina]